MTEDEARMRWCPMVRSGDSLREVAENRDCQGGLIIEKTGHGVKWNCCIASACMMWQWYQVGTYLSNEDVVKKIHEHGFCGLSRP
jgi:hypothetical protein